MHRLALPFLLIAVSACPLRAADEKGTLILHFLQLPVGEETYTVTTQPDNSLLLKAHFEYTERGSRVPLDASLHMKADLTPLQFEAKGKSYRPFSVDAAFSVDETRQAPLPLQYFTLNGYAPFSVQMMLLRYWAVHGKPARLPQFPAEAAGTEVEISATGQDTVEADGRAVRLARYSLGNVVWGRESIWLNEPARSRAR